MRQSEQKQMTVQSNPSNAHDNMSKTSPHNKTKKPKTTFKSKNNQNKPYIKKLTCNRYNNGLKKERKKPNLSLFSFLELIHGNLRSQKSINDICSDLAHYKKSRKGRFNPILSNIVMFIALSRYRVKWELYSEYSYVKPRTLRKYLKKLVDLKWIFRMSDGNYHVNPIITFLIEDLDISYWFLLEYASFQIDLFDLLNLPLVNLLRMRQGSYRKPYSVKKVDLKFYRFNRGYLKPFFVGFVQIKLELSNGEECSTILPVNLHGQTVFGTNETRNLYEHYCIPLKWDLFDVKECQYWSGWSEEAQRTVYLHFDNSISLLYLPDYKNYLFFNKPVEKAIEKWNGEEYVEFCEFETLRRLFQARFVKNRRNLTLFKELGLEYKTLSKKTLVSI